MIKFLHKLSKKEYIQWIISIVLSLMVLIGIIFSQLKKNPSFDETFLKNKVARIDIIPVKGKNIEMTIKSEAALQYPDRLKSAHGQGAVLNIPITKSWKTYPIVITLDKPGKLKFIFRGPWKNDGHKNIPIFVNYKNLQINGSSVLIPLDITHDNNFQKPVFVKKGKIDISVDVKLPQISLSNVIKNNPINPYILFSIFVVMLLIIRKIIRYCARFYKTNYSRIDIVFLAVFVVILLLPMSHFSDALKSEQENRVLAKKPKFIEKDKINDKFGPKFDLYFNDRFLGRETLINAYNNLKMSLYSYMQNTLEVEGFDEYIFQKALYEEMSQKIPEDKIRLIAKNIAHLQDFAKKNNIDLYIMIPPSKEDVYMYKLGNMVNNINSKDSIIYPLIKFISQNNKINILYPRELFLKEHRDYTHYKVDHHWTEFGAFLGCNELLKEMQKKYSDIRLLKESDFNTFYSPEVVTGNIIGKNGRDFRNGSDCKRLGVRKLCPSVSGYKYYDHKNANELEIDTGPMKMSKITHYEKGMEANVTVLGNSYGRYLMQFVPYSFKNVQYLRVNNNEKIYTKAYDMRRFEKHILDFNTDILVFYLPSAYWHNFMDLYRYKENKNQR